jgi:signal transduction histidine kinase
MIQDLLDANKLKAGEKLPIHPCEMCLNDVVSESVADFSALYGDRFLINGPKEACGFWCGKAMRRMVDNLLDNAVKYGDPVKPVEISIDQNQDQTSLKVHNYGPVIPENERKKLFEPFKRARTNDKKTGWGIGLSLVKGLVEAHNGEVFLDSKPSEGTSFKLVFPNKVPATLH